MDQLFMGEIANFTHVSRSISSRIQESLKRFNEMFAIESCFLYYK